MEPIQIILLMCILLLGFAGIYYFTTNKERMRRARALSVISGTSHAGGMGNSKNARDKRRADLAKKLKETDVEERKKRKGTIKDLLVQAGFFYTSPIKFWMIAFVFGTVAILSLKLIWGVAGLKFIFAIIICYLGIPRFVLKFLVKRRQKKFLKEFPDVLESMMRLLKAGMPVGEAIAMVAREFEGPVSEEMQRVYDEQKVGIPLGEAVLGVAVRVPLPEVQMFATGISIQQQTGSSLSEILQNLATVIRARFHLRRKVEALSAEAKASAGIIASLPVFVATALYFVNRDYIILLFITETGKNLLTGSAVWMSLGVLVMRQMINFRV